MDIERIDANERMSQIVIHGDTIYLAGQVGNSGDPVGDQTRQCLENVDALLEKAGSSRARILQATVWLADMADFDDMNAVWDRWFDPGTAPARACGESRLVRPGFRVEMIIVAAR